MKSVEWQTSLIQQANYGEEEFKAEAMYALQSHPKVWEFVVLKKLSGGGQNDMQPSQPLDKTVTALDEQNMKIRTETVGTLTTDGSTPKHNNRVLEIERSDCVAKIGQVSSEGSQCGSVYSDDGNMPTLTAGTHGDANSRICTEYRIRKLTPIECWRLMDFSDEDFHKAESVNSNTQLYKQAGNSIVVNVLVAILGQLFAGKEDVYKDCKVKREDANFFEENV